MEAGGGRVRGGGDVLMLCSTPSICMAPVNGYFAYHVDLGAGIRAIRRPLGPGHEQRLAGNDIGRCIEEVHSQAVPNRIRGYWSILYQAKTGSMKTLA